MGFTSELGGREQNVSDGINDPEEEEVLLLSFIPLLINPLKVGNDKGEEEEAVEIGWASVSVVADNSPTREDRSVAVVFRRLASLLVSIIVVVVGMPTVVFIVVRICGTNFLRVSSLKSLLYTHI